MCFHKKKAVFHQHLEYRFFCGAPAWRTIYGSCTLLLIITHINHRF